jgi:hypothetical protein
MASPSERASGGRPLIPRAHVTAWRATAPWPTDAQIEQDLVPDLFIDPVIYIAPVIYI